MGDKNDKLFRIGVGARWPNTTEVSNLAGVAWSLWLSSCTFSIIVPPNLKKISVKTDRPIKQDLRIWKKILKPSYDIRLRQLKRDILVYLYAETKRSITREDCTCPEYQ